MIAIKFKASRARTVPASPRQEAAGSIAADTSAAEEFFDEPVFFKRNAAKKICGPPPEADQPRRLAPPTGLPSYLCHLWTVPLLTPQQEQHHFRKLNFLKYQRSVILGRANRTLRGKKREQLDRVERDIVETRNLIVESNLRLVVSLAKKFASSNRDDFDEFVSVGNAAIIRAVERFDYRRGFRFSTYAYQAIQRSIFDLYQKDSRVRDRFVSDGSDAIAGSVSDAGEADRLEIAAAENHNFTKVLMTNLDDRERRIVKAHFGIVRGTEPSSLRVIGDELGLSKQRIRQLLIRALDKMRASASQMRVAAP